ncbi:MAG: hypothetical protein H7Z20_09075 [Bdellovibrio sp.]|nr:hypothetical protein [Methylotenera sp.]
MHKLLTALLAGAFAATLSICAFAADAAKPAVTATAKVEASKVATVKKDSGIKASVKKLATPSAKKVDVKLK